MNKLITLLAFINLCFLSSLSAQDISVSGEVLRHNGDPVPDVTVFCSNGDSIITDANGSFTFSGLTSGENYQIDAHYEATVFEELSVLDASYLRYMILFIIEGTDEEWLAADFGQEGGYNGLDYIWLVKAMLKVEENTTPNPTYPNVPWRFFDSEVEPNSTQTGIELLNLTSDSSGLQLLAIKSGDVAINKDFIPPPASAPNPIFFIEDSTLTQGQELVMQVRGRDMIDILGYQHSLSWDPGYLEFISAESSINNELWLSEDHLENGLLPLAHVNVFLEPHQQDSSVYEVRFNILQDVNSLLDVIDFDSSFINAEMVYQENINGIPDLYLIEAEYMLGEPPAIHTVSGEVLRHNGDPVPDVTVFCSNGDSVLTDANGNFAFSSLPTGEDYFIDGFYEATVYEELSVLDAVYVRYLLTSILQGTDPEWLATDFDQGGAHSGGDYVLTVQAALRFEDAGTPDPLFPEFPWRFFGSEFDFNSTETGINLLNLTSDTSSLELLAVKSGDAAISKDFVPPPPDAPSPIFYIEDTELTQGEEITVHVRGEDMIGIAGFQHSLSWDTDYLEFISAENSLPTDTWFNDDQMNDGLLPVAFINAFMLTIEEDSSIYKVQFNVLQDVSSMVGVIDFDSSLISPEVVYTEDFSELYLIEAAYEFVDPPVVDAVTDVDDVYSFELEPNPVNEELRFSIALDGAGLSFVSLYDIRGRLLQELSFDAQMIEDRIDVSELPRGIYYLRLLTDGGVVGQSFVKQ